MGAAVLAEGDLAGAGVVRALSGSELRFDEPSDYGPGSIGLSFDETLERPPMIIMRARAATRDGSQQSEVPGLFVPMPAILIGFTVSMLAVAGIYITLAGL
jgi:hypothetical protein